MIPIIHGMMEDQFTSIHYDNRTNLHSQTQLYPQFSWRSSAKANRSEHIEPIASPHHPWITENFVTTLTIIDPCSIAGDSRFLRRVQCVARRRRPEPKSLISMKGAEVSEVSERKNPLNPVGRTNRITSYSLRPARSVSGKLENLVLLKNANPNRF